MHTLLPLLHNYLLLLLLFIPKNFDVALLTATLILLRYFTRYVFVATRHVFCGTRNTIVYAVLATLPPPFYVYAVLATLLSPFYV